MIGVKSPELLSISEIDEIYNKAILELGLICAQDKSLFETIAQNITKDILEEAKRRKKVLAR